MGRDAGISLSKVPVKLHSQLFFFYSQAEERSRLDESLRQYTEAYEASAAELEKARAAAAAAAATSSSAADDGASEAVRRRLEAEVEEMNQVRTRFFAFYILKKLKKFFLACRRSRG